MSTVTMNFPKITAEALDTMKPLESRKTLTPKPPASGCTKSVLVKHAITLTLSMTRDIHYMNEGMERKMRLSYNGKGKVTKGCRNTIASSQGH